MLIHQSKYLDIYLLFQVFTPIFKTPRPWLKQLGPGVGVGQAGDGVHGQVAGVIDELSVNMFRGSMEQGQHGGCG